jgi:probable addiction module antidote protein
MTDTSQALDTLEAVAIHLAQAFESGDPGLIAAALSNVAKSKGCAELAAAVGVPRQQLADALLSGEMPLDLTLGIMKVVDLHLPGERH